MKLTYVSVCSGIEAVSVAWQPLGFEPIHFAEIDPFCSALLDHRYPEVPNLGDITQYEAWPEFDDRTRPAVLVGGTPCQSFSIAGLRGGMADPRGQLTLSYLEIARRYRPRWVVWENVPGALSSDGGRALGAFLRGLALLGYGFAYRVLDAQYFGLAQRRKRVFVVGHLGDWRRAAAVLFERKSLLWHPPPSREAGQAVAPTLGAGPASGGRTYGTSADDVESLIPNGAGCLNSVGGHSVPGNSVQDADQGYLIPSVSLCLNAGGMGRIDAESETLIAHSLLGKPNDSHDESKNTYVTNTLRATGGAVPAPLAFTAQDYGADVGDISPMLRSGGHAGSHANNGVMPAVAFDARQNDVLQYGDKTGPIDTDGFTFGIQQAASVRRLMPVECERLQGFPDGYTLIAYGPRKKKLEDDYLKYLLRDGTLTREECYGRASDGPRYKALGNSMAVPVLAWIGRRIKMVDSL